MPIFEIDRDRGLYYEHTPPSSRQNTFVFVNALTGSTGHWEAEIAPALRAEGFGTLSYNFRGQADSPFAPEDRLDEALIVSDLTAIARGVAGDGGLVLVGLSIGGLFAAKAHLAGLAAEGLVLMNTLRKPSVALDWVNEAIYRAARLGGGQLVMDMYLPMLAGPDFLATARANCLKDVPYEPFPEGSGLLELIRHSRSTDWSPTWESLALPVLVMTGARDRVFLDRAAVDDLMARLPDAREQVLPETGHLIPIEAPKASIEALVSFARGLEG